MSDIIAGENLLFFHVTCKQTKKRVSWQGKDKEFLMKKEEKQFHDLIICYKQMKQPLITVGIFE